MTQLRLPRGVAAAIAALVVTAVGCGSGGTPVSTTPVITVDNAGTELSAALLTESDVRAVPGLSTLAAIDFSKIPITENPDPRGPCGAVVPALKLDNASGRLFSSERVTIFEFVVEADAYQEAYFAALQADAVEGCPPHQSTTNVATTQTVSNVSFLPVEHLEAAAIGWTSSIEAGAPPPTSGGTWMLGASTRFSLIIVIAAEPIPSLTMDALARAAIKRITM